MGINVIDTLLVKIETTSDRAISKVETFQKNLNKVNRAIKIQDRLNKAGLGSATQFNKKLAKTLAETELRQRNFKKELAYLQRGLLSMGATFMFMGMVIKRFFQDILNSLLQNYLMIEGETGPVNEAINNLKANVFALGFELFDAFVKSGLLQVWIDRINTIVDWVRSWDEKNKANECD